MTQKELGQYFTVDEGLQKFVFGCAQNKGQLLLEPSFGAGHLLKPFLASNPDYPMVCCELDKKVVPIVAFVEGKQTVIYGDFMKETFTEKFKSIVGNPPYVKVGKSKNLYLQFIEKCLGLLDSDGEMIFIVPSDFLKLTSAAEIIRSMVKQGSFTDFLYPNDEKLFIDSVVDVVIFRYQKGLTTRSCMKNGLASSWRFSEGIITINSNQTNTIEDATVPLGELFDCYVGFVSGRDSVFCNDLGKLEVLVDKDKVKKFICIDAFPTGVKAVDDHLNANKKELLERKIRKFGDTNWFTWGAIRNKASIDERMGKDCIYVRTMTRKTDVAFIGKVQYFSGALLCLVPKEEGLDLAPILKVLNGTDVKKDYLYSGRFKIGQKQVRFVRI
jgi:adenine-specific DNA-methyltransferase